MLIPLQLLQKIEDVVETIILQLVSREVPSLPELPLEEEESASSQEDDAGVARKTIVFWTPGQKQTRRFVRLIQVLSTCYDLIRHQKIVQQREVYYLHNNLFQSQAEANKAIQDVHSALGCARHDVGIVNSPRGIVCGRGEWQQPQSDRWIDLQQPASIAGCIFFPGNLFRSTDAKYILVVEKECIFNRLCEDRFCESVPSIMVTGKGFPDHATRALVWELSRQLKLPILGLVDYNPFGLALLLTYKIGSLKAKRRELQAVTQHTVDIKWLGLRHSDLSGFPARLDDDVVQDWTDTDRRKAASMQHCEFFSDNPEYKEELDQMAELGIKLELEVLHSFGIGHLANNFLPRKIAGQDYI